MGRRRRAPARKLQVRRLLMTVAVVAALGLSLFVVGRLFDDGEPDRHSDRTEAEVALPTEQEGVGSVEFDLGEGDKSVVSLDLNALFEASTGEQRGVYVIVGIACSGVDGSSSDSMSGTQNLVHDEEVQLTTQFVYTASKSGTHRCNASFRAPNWDAEFGDATAHVDAQLTATGYGMGFAEEATAEGPHPIVPDAGEAATVINETFEVPQDTEWIEVGATSHLTSCTIENGSKDGTEENLCEPGMVDDRGSDVKISSRVEVLDGDEVCETYSIEDSSTHISYQVHHLFHGISPKRIELGEGLCGDRLRLIQVIDNEGPAPLVVHRASSSIVVAGA